MADLSFLLSQCELYGIDIVPATVSSEPDGSKMKRPITGTKGYLDPVDNIIARFFKTKQQKDVFLNADYHGYILKHGGVPIGENYLCILDIDCKEDKDLGAEVYNKVVDIISAITSVSDRVIRQCTERTISGGYHVYCTIDKPISYDKIIIDSTNKNVRGVEVEIFTQSRFMVAAPSEGYELLLPSTDPSKNSINFAFVESINLRVEDITILNNMLSTRAKTTSGFDNKDNSDVVVLTNDLTPETRKKIEKSWKNLEKFMNGIDAADWDAISNGSDNTSYDYVRLNIMPWYLLTGRKEEFLDIIEKYGGRYLRMWRDYPDFWLSRHLDGNTVIGADGRKHLAKAGIIEGIKNPNHKGDSNAKDSYTAEYVNNYMKHIVGHALVIFDSVYSYCEKDHYYKLMSIDELKSKITHYYMSNGLKALAHDNIKSLAMTTLTYARAYAEHGYIDPKKRDVQDMTTSYTIYDFSKDRDYKNSVIPIVFNNGTLYIHTSNKLYNKPDPHLEFKPGHFSRNDKVLYSIKRDYTPDLLKRGRVEEFDSTALDSQRSIVIEWFRTKFTPKHLRFIQLFFGQLLLPSYSPSVALIIISQKGAMGKSTLIETLTSIYDDKSYSSYKSKFITSTPMSDFHKTFCGPELAGSLVNISTELDKKVDSEMFKKVISRETLSVQKKGVDSFEIKPLSKHIAMANKLPQVNTDGGVQRRMAVFETSEDIVRPDIDGSEFTDLFMDDSDSLVSFMLIGLLELSKLGFPDMSHMFKSEYEDRVSILKESNSPVYRWLIDEGASYIISATLTAQKGADVKDLYDTYKKYCSNNGDASRNIGTFKQAIKQESGYVIHKDPTSLPGGKILTSERISDTHIVGMMKNFNVQKHGNIVEYGKSCKQERLTQLENSRHKTEEFIEGYDYFNNKGKNYPVLETVVNVKTPVNKPVVKTEVRTESSSGPREALKQGVNKSTKKFDF